MGLFIDQDDDDNLEVQVITVPKVEEQCSVLFLAEEERTMYDKNAGIMFPVVGVLTEPEWCEPLSIILNKSGESASFYADHCRNCRYYDPQPIEHHARLRNVSDLDNAYYEVYYRDGDDNAVEVETYPIRDYNYREVRDEIDELNENSDIEECNCRDEGLESVSFPCRAGHDLEFDEAEPITAPPLRVTQALPLLHIDDKLKRPMSEEEIIHVAVQWHTISTDNTVRIGAPERGPNCYNDFHVCWATNYTPEAVPKSLEAALTAYALTPCNEDLAKIETIRERLDLAESSLLQDFDHAKGQILWHAESDEPKPAAVMTVNRIAEREVFYRLRAMGAQSPELDAFGDYIVLLLDTFNISGFSGYITRGLKRPCAVTYGGAFLGQIPPDALAEIQQPTSPELTHV